MKIIGLTGGIASGKSTVSRFLKELGALIIDADILARRVVQPGEKAYTEIVDYFGNEILALDGLLNRKKLAARVFGNNDALSKLNSIIHPEVIAATKAMLEQAKKEGAEVAVVDAPLLIEAGMTPLVEEVWVVAIDEEEQLRRAITRDKVSREEIEARIAAQMSLALKKEHATRIIDNSNSLEETYKQVKEYYRELISE